MDPEEAEEIRRYLPNGTQNLRACLRCRQIMTKGQFIDFGCPNCRDTLDMQGSEARVVACTSANYQGFVSLIRPGAFMSRLNGLEHKRPGCYALTVRGTIPEYMMNESEMERAMAGSPGPDRKGGADSDESEAEEIRAARPTAPASPTEPRMARVPVTPAGLSTPVGAPAAAAPASVGFAAAAAAPGSRSQATAGAAAATPDVLRAPGSVKRAAEDPGAAAPSPKLPRGGEVTPEDLDKEFDAILEPDAQ